MFSLEDAAATSGANGHLVHEQAARPLWRRCQCVGGRCHRLCGVRGVFVLTPCVWACACVRDGTFIVSHAWARVLSFACACLLVRLLARACVCVCKHAFATSCIHHGRACVGCCCCCFFAKLCCHRCSWLEHCRHYLPSPLPLLSPLSFLRSGSPLPNNIHTATIRTTIS